MRTTKFLTQPLLTTLADPAAGAAIKNTTRADPPRLLELGHVAKQPRHDRTRNHTQAPRRVVNRGR